MIFDGRFLCRTNVLDALGPNDLASSMVSPWEMTVPKNLSQRAYGSALFGKLHLTLQGPDPVPRGVMTPTSEASGLALSR